MPTQQPDTLNWKSTIALVVAAIAGLFVAYGLSRIPVAKCIDHCRAQGLSMSSYFRTSDGEKCICLVEPEITFESTIETESHGAQSVSVEVYRRNGRWAHVKTWRQDDNPTPDESMASVHEVFDALPPLLADQTIDSVQVFACLGATRTSYGEMACSWCQYKQRDGSWVKEKCGT